MAGRRPTVEWTERRKLVVGAIALLVASLFVATLATAGVGSGPVAMAMGVASVALLVVATLSIGTSEQTTV